MFSNGQVPLLRSLARSFSDHVVLPLMPREIFVYSQSCGVSVSIFVVQALGVLDEPKSSAFIEAILYHNSEYIIKDTTSTRRIIAPQAAGQGLRGDGLRPDRKRRAVGRGHLPGGVRRERPGGLGEPPGGSATEGKSRGGRTKEKMLVQ